jgi:hypothetical protein
MIHRALLTLLILTASAVAAPANEPAQPPAAAPAREPAKTPAVDPAKLEAAKAMPADPAAWMERFMQGLRTDTDHQAAHGIKLVRALLETDRWREARPVVALMGDYRKTLALYLLAAEAARDGEKGASDPFFAEAERQPPPIHDFERDEIMAARVQALGARGELAKARQELGGIRAPDLRADSRARLYEFVPVETAAAEANELLIEEKVAPSVKGRALLLAAATLERAGRADEAKAVAIVGIETLCKAADVDTIPLFHQAVLLLARMKAQAEAARWAEVCLGFAERTDARAHWKARDMRLSAECLQAAGRTEEAAAVLKRIPNLTTKLDAVSYSRGGMEAASAFLLSGQTDLFHKASAHVLDLTRHHPHHRARAMAAVDVLATYLRQKMELSPEVRMRLEESARSVENDPQFQNPV